MILFRDYLVEYSSQRAFEDTFKGLGDTQTILLKQPPHRWYVGTRLFLDDVALELTFDGGNMRMTFFFDVLYPVWQTVRGCIVLMNATSTIDNQWFNYHLQNVRSHINTMMGYYGDDFPVVVAALKKEDEDTFTVDELRILLNSPRQFELRDLPIVICEPKDRESVKQVLITALERGMDYIAIKIVEDG